eukprot:PhM_4_TR2084/c2_g1_i1/m.91660
MPMYINRAGLTRLAASRHTECLAQLNDDAICNCPRHQRHCHVEGTRHRHTPTPLVVTRHNKNNKTKTTTVPPLQPAAMAATSATRSPMTTTRDSIGGGSSPISVVRPNPASMTFLNESLYDDPLAHPRTHERGRVVPDYSGRLCSYLPGESLRRRRGLPQPTAQQHCPSSDERVPRHSMYIDYAGRCVTSDSGHLPVPGNMVPHQHYHPHPLRSYTNNINNSTSRREMYVPVVTENINNNNNNNKR